MTVRENKCFSGTQINLKKFFFFVFILFFFCCYCPRLIFKNYFISFFRDKFKESLMTIWKFKCILVITSIIIKLKARYILNLKEKVVKTFTFFPVKMTTTPHEFI